MSFMKNTRRHNDPADLHAENLRLVEENKRLKQELVTDELTGLYNARHLRAQLAQKISEGLKKGEKPALLFLDVDHFKEINEEHGHEAAGRVLSQVGCQIAALIRGDDLAFRYGGDEFVVLVSGGREGADVVGERIRRTLAQRQFHVTGLRGPVAVRLTVSVGLCPIVDGARVEDILNQADRAMFEAKRRSRNRLVIAEKPL